MKWKLSGLTLMALFISACSTMPLVHDQDIWQKSPPKNSELNFYAAGRLSLKQENHGAHALFDWQNNHSRFALIHIQSPLGNTLGSLCRDQQGYVVEDAAHRRYFAKEETNLMHHLLGYDIPLQYLDWWLLGHAAPDVPYETQGTTLIQHGWRITRQLDAKGHPYQLTLKGYQREIILLFDHFALQGRNLTLSCQP